MKQKLKERIRERTANLKEYSLNPHYADRGHLHKAHGDLYLDRQRHLGEIDLERERYTDM